MTKYPDLSEHGILSLDIECYDPDIKDLGTGVYRKDGFVLGVSLATEQGFSEYLNIKHYDHTIEESTKNIEYLKEVLALPNKKLGTFFNYDIDWLENRLGLKVNGQLIDITIAEALLDENQKSFSLDFMAKKYLNKGKYKTKIDQFCIDNNLKGDARNWLFRMPYNLVREYAIADAILPLQIYKIQEKLMREQDLLDLFKMECDLIRVLLLMRKTGARIDNKKRKQNAYKLQGLIDEKSIALWQKYGRFNYNSSPQVARVLKQKGIEYPETEKGNPSIKGNFLKNNQGKYPLIKSIYELRKADKALGTFLSDNFAKFITSDSLIHCSFYNMKNDDYGTRSGRISAAKPNTQQIPSPSRDGFLGTLCREIFIPFDNCDWVKLDYSQIEYRFIAHYAIGKGSQEIVDKYNKNPDQDYHQYIMDLTNLQRTFAKNLNFGVAFGMGLDGMCDNFGWERGYAYNILKIYHEKAPYIKSTIDAVQKAATRRGYIKTILNRRSRLIDKSKAYIMYNRLNQGSAADLMKRAMLDIYNAGIFDTLPLHLSVHDELDVSKPRTPQGDEALKEMKYIMENCIKIKVPIKVDIDVQQNWAK